MPRGIHRQGKSPKGKRNRISPKPPGPGGRLPIGGDCWCECDANGMTTMPTGIGSCNNNPQCSSMCDSYCSSLQIGGGEYINNWSECYGMGGRGYNRGGRVR